MSQWWLKNIRSALIYSLGLVVLASCSNAERSFGGGVLSKGNVVTTVLDDVGIIVKNEGPEEYKQRPPLAIPISTEELPEPESDENASVEPPPDGEPEPAQATAHTDGSYNEAPDESKQAGSDSTDDAPKVENSIVLNSTDGGEEEEAESDAELLQETQNECDTIPGKGRRSCPLIKPPEGYN